MSDTTDMNGNATPDLRVDLRPRDAMIGGALAAVVVAMVSDATVSWILVAAGLAYGAWSVGRRDVRWPDQLYRVLRDRGLTSHQAPRQHVVATAPLPFRPLSIPDVFAAAGRVLARQWPVLLGVPVLVFGVFLAALYVVAEVVVSPVISRAASAATGATGGDVFASIAIVFAVVFVLLLAVAFPADAFLLSVFTLVVHRCVVGDDAVRGIAASARGRMGATCRMMAVFYMVSFTPNIVFLGLLAVSPSTLFGPGFLLLAFVIVAATFVFGLLTSLAPLVMMIEGKGVVESFRRSVALARPAFARLLLIHGLWSVCAIVLIWPSFVFGTSWVMFGLTLCAMIAAFRVLQMVIYLDLRMRQENYAVTLREEWTANTSGTS